MQKYYRGNDEGGNRVSTILKYRISHYYPPIGDFIMKNQEFIKVLRQLKKEGVSFKVIAEDCNIPVSKVYYYINYKGFPYAIRKRMEYILLNKYKEIIEL